MSKIILFVFEGVKTEAHIYNSLRKYFLSENDHSIICATFNTVIYKLYKDLQKYDELELKFDLIEELRPNNTGVLDGIVRKNIAEIYLIFDYDGHASNASDEKLTEMLEYFNNETENGKLYISYPMIEAIKHLKSDIPFHETTAEAKQKTSYKERVSHECNECYKNFWQWDHQHWAVIIQEHCRKLNFITTGHYTFPNQTFEQSEIFEAQLEKYINPDNKVAVLSAFPVLLLDYYGAT
ncbi:MAG: hypothetical protein Q9M50_05445 [Methylococcales bacterium]|nr:hypothetical protein [Methylococcales bacterium]